MKPWLVRIIVLCLLVLIFVSLSQIIPVRSTQRTGHITLLTVSSDPSGTNGGTADLYLTITPGQGNVFIDTFPFTKLDTQISTRFAKEIACKTVQQDCDRYDFFYTIRASSNIVGGPSAGAALAAVTAAVLLDKPIDQGVAITGTINSGGIVGSVAGIRDKVSAAQKKGLHTVLIPRWTWDEQTQLLFHPNASIPPPYSALIISSPRLTNISVQEIVTIDQAISVITGEEFTMLTGNPRAPPEYYELMEVIANRLCNRSSDIIASTPYINQSPYWNLSNTFLQSSRYAFDRKDFYSAASFCYSANIRLRNIEFENLSITQLQGIASRLNTSIDQKKTELASQELLTITDLQTRAIVDERLNEAQSYLEQDASASSVSRAVERHYSALVWSGFFQLEGTSLSLDQTHLRKACEAKLAEAEERKSYLSLLLSSYLDETDELKSAYDWYHREEYALCIFKASKEKARIDLIISASAVNSDNFNDFLDEKLKVTQGLIFREIQEGRFPVMGYSYYEYAHSLKAEDPVNAALFASYALELSDLGLYFPKKKSLSNQFFDTMTSEFFIGFVCGVLFLLIAWALLKPPVRRLEVS